MTTIEFRCTLMAVKATLCAGAFVVAVPASTLSAAADPVQFPDLSNYVAVNTADYTTFHAYLTAGVQFSTPGGYRCRMSFTHKQNGAHMECWGTLPGTPDNYVGLNYFGGTNSPPTAFSTIDLSAMDIIPPTAGLPGTTVNPEDYNQLPPHSKVSYTDGPLQTCGVDTSMTACELTDHGEQHGFVLSPQGSWTF